MTEWAMQLGLVLEVAFALLLCAAIGVSVAVRQYVLALGVTVLALLALFSLRSLERWVQRRTTKDGSYGLALTTPHLRFAPMLRLSL